MLISVSLRGCVRSRRHHATCGRQSQIDWTHIPSTITTDTFKRIRAFILSLKANQAIATKLVSPAVLVAELNRADPDHTFDENEVVAAAKYLQNHGYVTILSDSDGTPSILLSPELLANLAASVVLEARRNSQGLGAIEEEGLLAGGYSFPEVAEMSSVERSTLVGCLNLGYRPSALTCSAKRGKKSGRC